MAVAYDLLIIKSQHSPVYDEILRGLHSTRKFTERVVTLSDYSEVDVKRIVREDSPKVIVTFGELALDATRKLNKVPVVPLMSSTYRQRENLDHVAGIEILIAPERYLSLFKQIKSQRVGVIYSKAKSGSYVQRAQKYAAKYGITLVLKEVTSPRETSAQLASLKGNVDALWMLPDSTAVTKETVEGYTHFSIDQKVPFISYASAYLPLGALAVVEMDKTDLGVQAGELIQELMEGQIPAVAPSPRKAMLRFNQNVVRKLGISPDLIEKIQQGWD